MADDHPEPFFPDHRPIVEFRLGFQRFLCVCISHSGPHAPQIPSYAPARDPPCRSMRLAKSQRVKDARGLRNRRGNAFTSGGKEHSFWKVVSCF